jgi:hypothetical protein
MGGTGALSGGRYRQFLIFITDNRGLGSAIGWGFIGIDNAPGFRIRKQGAQKLIG